MSVCALATCPWSSPQPPPPTSRKSGFLRFGSGEPKQEPWRCENHKRLVSSIYQLGSDIFKDFTGNRCMFPLCPSITSPGDQ